MDDANRENEGDLVIPAQFATADSVNFMARHGRGLICLALTRRRVEELQLPMMTRSGGSRFDTPFTASIEAAAGVTTGISAADRAHTIAVAISPASKPGDIVTPGHIFPLRAHDGGTLSRAGHTEAAVDLARCAGLNPAGVICEIMNEDGSMARLPDLIEFSQRHGIRIGTVADLIDYRSRTERLVEQKGASHLHHPRFGEWRLVTFRDAIECGEHVALVKGDVTGDRSPVLTMLHFQNVIGDILVRDSPHPVESAMQKISQLGRGAVIIVNDARSEGLPGNLAAQEACARLGPRQRDFDRGAQMLVALGIARVTLAAPVERASATLERYGLSGENEQFAEIC